MKKIETPFKIITVRYCRFILLIIFLVWFPVAQADHEGPIFQDVNWGPIYGLTIATYSMVSVIPALVEYYQHDIEEASFFWIYAGGFIGGVAGLSVGAINGSSNVVLGSMVVGMVLGNKLSHHLYTRIKQRKLSFYPSISNSNASISFSYTY